MKALSDEFISEYARLEGISPKESRRRIDTMLQALSAMLYKIGVVHLRCFGTFAVKTRKKGRYLNNHTGIMADIPITKVLHFRPSAVIKRLINSKVRKDMYDTIKANKNGGLGKA